MLVVDTSAMLEAIAGRRPPAALVERLAHDADLHAPHLFDVEMLHALRRLTLAGALTADHAQDARTDFGDLTILRYPHEPLADRAWRCATT